ncbi:MAG: cold-shock protein [Candidatus Electrothrix sp. AW2]|nr:cold-shock protein [Candidatus Electrothrix gigas]
MKRLVIALTVSILLSITPSVIFGKGKTCKEIKSCEEAKKELAAGNKRLDRDNDGIPCENLCGDKKRKK